MDGVPTFDAAQVHRAGFGPVSFGDDSKLFVTFRIQSMLDKVQSREKGRPVYRAVDYIRIQQPGERDYTDRPALQNDQYRFPRQWAAYQAGKQDIPDGTPLSTLFPNNPEISDNLRHFKVFTVEQLAALNDTQKQNIGMGAQQFQQKAQQFLDGAAKGKGFHELEARLNALELKNKELTDKNSALEAALADGDGDESTPKRRGRPPKVSAV